MQAVRPTKTRLNATERRQTIMDAAVTLFAEKGFRGTTTREIAQAVGVSEPVLYEHFPSKRDLYAAILEAKSSEGLARLREISARYLELNDDAGFLRQVGEMILDYHVKSPELPRLMIRSSLEDPDLLQFDRQIKQGFLGIVEAYLTRRIEQGALRPVDCRIVARAMSGSFLHLGQSVMLCPDDLGDPYEALGPMVDLMLRGMIRPEAILRADSMANSDESGPAAETKGTA